MAALVGTFLVILGMLFWNYTAIGSSVTRCNLNFSKVSNVRLRGSFLVEVKGVGSAVRCSVLCVGNVSCRSFNYGGTEKSCELNRGTKTTNPWDAVTGYSYYEMDAPNNKSRTVARYAKELRSTKERTCTTTKRTTTGLPANGHSTEKLTSTEEPITSQRSSTTNPPSLEQTSKERITSKETSTETPTTTPLSETVQSTCSAFRENGYTTNGYYMIDPDGPEDDPAFLVYCEMTTVGVTVVDNTMRNQMITVPVDEDSYEVDIDYYASEDQIKALIGQSTRCYQFLLARCRNAKLWDGSTQWSWWVSRKGNQMSNWGGVPTATEGCSCQLTQECSGGSTSLCNCGGVADEWSTDQGQLTDKDVLPVLELHFKNTAPSGELMFQIGSLKCM